MLPLLRGDAFEFTPYTDDALEYIASNLRPGDRDEVHATVGHTRYLDALRVSAIASASAIVAVSAYGEPIAVLGVTTVSVLYNTGSPWLLATSSVVKHRRALITAGEAYTAAMLKHYTRLENHVDARNKASVAWLQRLGYTIHEAQPHGALRLPFHRFSIER